MAQKLLNFFQSCKIYPNMVTLDLQLGRQSRKENEGFRISKAKAKIIILDLNTTNQFRLYCLSLQFCCTQMPDCMAHAISFDFIESKLELA